MTTGVPSKIRRVIRQRLDVAENRITLDASFMGDLGADSLALMDLTLALEATFDIEISVAEAEQIRTVREAVASIERHVKARERAPH